MSHTSTPAGSPPTGPTQMQHRSLRALAGLLERFQVGVLEVELPDGRTRTFGPGPGPVAQLRLRDWAVPGALLRRGSVGLGETYVDGGWSSPDLVGLLCLLLDNRPALRHVTPSMLAAVAGELVRHRLRDNRPGQARRNISAHYDLSNELYAAFLDASMTYSCAYFEHEEQPLEEAQAAKQRRLAERARIGADQHVLEIGCGWGSFAVQLAQERGCRVTGITLSERQAQVARERAARHGLTDRVRIEVVDYRHVTGRYDRIVSVEMLEAVGHRHLGTYFATLDRLLVDDGLAALQVITIPEQRYAAYRRRPDFLQRHVFPGGHVPSLTALTQAMGRGSGLVVRELEGIGRHYAITLRRWRERFLAAAEQVRGLGFDERFLRLWEFYLAYCEAGFAARQLDDLQLVLGRPGRATPVQPRISAASTHLEAAS